MLDTAMTISLSLVAFDKMSRVIRDSVTKSDEQFKKLQDRIKKVSDGLDKIGKAATVAGGTLTAISAANLKMAADFEANMASVSTLIDTNVENLDSMKNEVLEIAKRTPVALEGLTSSLYDIRSAGIAAEDQFKVLEKSAQLGLAGLGATSEAVDLVTSSLNAFQLKGEKADRVYDTIFKTVKFGKTTISGLAQGFGAVAGTVAAAGVELDDYMAAIAALTTTGQPAAQAHTQIKAAIAGMTRESDEAKIVFQQLGAKSFKDLIQKSGGLVNALSAVAQKANGNDAAILKLFGSTQAFNAVLGLTTKQHEAYLQALDAMRNGPSLVDEGYAKKLDTINAQMQRFQNYAQKIGIDMGNALVPYFRRFLDIVQKIMDAFDRLPDGLKNKIAVTIAGLGIGLSGLGIAAISIGTIVKGYGEFLKIARDLNIALVGNRTRLLQTLGLSSAAKNFTFGNLFADIKALDTSMRAGLKATFTALPTNIAASTAALKTWISTSIQAMPTNLMNGLTAFKNSFLGIPSLIKNAAVAFKSFSLTLLTSPIGWIALAIAGVALLIYKYWKPITGFFRGVWNGLKEGLQPLMPLFKRMGEALQPIIAPIKAIIEWFKKLIKPVEDTGGAAENMGLRFGKAIAGIIVKLVELITKAFECGSKITSMLAEGIMSGVAKVKNCITKVAQVIRDFLPHSPAKTGPLKDLNKVKIVETVAQTITPAPMQTAMNKSMQVVMDTIPTQTQLNKSLYIVANPIPNQDFITNTINNFSDPGPVNEKIIKTLNDISSTTPAQNIVINNLEKIQAPQPLKNIAVDSFQAIQLQTPVINLAPKILNELPTPMPVQNLSARAFDEMPKPMNFNNKTYNTRNNQSNASNSIVIHYNPTVTITGNETKEDFTKLLRKHKEELVRIFQSEADRRLRVTY